MFVCIQYLMSCLCALAELLVCPISYNSFWARSCGSTTCPQLPCYSASVVFSIVVYTNCTWAGFWLERYTQLAFRPFSVRFWLPDSVAAGGLFIGSTDACREFTGYEHRLRADEETRSTEIITPIYQWFYIASTDPLSSCRSRGVFVCSSLKPS